MTRKIQLVFATIIVVAISYFFEFLPLIGLWVLFLIYEYRAFINFRKIPFVLAMIILAAHFLRVGLMPVVGICLLIPALLLIQERWVIGLLRSIAWFTTAFWAFYGGILVFDRLAAGEAWMRLAFIMLAVTVFTWYSGFLLSDVRREYRRAEAEADEIARGGRRNLTAKEPK